MANYKGSCGSVNRRVANTLFSMLTENTGKALCDSGGAYGRNWERAQGKKVSDFLREPPATIKFDAEYKPKEAGGGYEKTGRYAPIYTLSLFHYLSQFVELDGICDEFNKRNKNAPDWEFDGAYGVCKDAGQWLESIGAEIGEAFNSYNWGAAFSQTIQGSFLRIGSENYLILQIHGGCDVRGGYTNTKLFKVENEYLPLFYLSATIDGVECEKAENDEGMMVLSDEKQREYGYGGAEAFFTWEEGYKPIVSVDLIVSE